MTEPYTNILAELSSRGVFKPNEINEIILGVYSVITGALRERSDTLLLTPTHFEWSSDGKVIGSFSIENLKPTISFRDALGLIIERDMLVREYLHLKSETQEKIAFWIEQTGPQ